MAYAPYHNGQLNGNPRIVGAFNEKTNGNRFEFSERPAEEKAIFAPAYDHQVFVGPFGQEETRAARILKTVAYVVVDEASDGTPIVEKWDLKNHIIYREAG